MRINGVPIIEALGASSRTIQLHTLLNSFSDSEVFDSAKMAAEMGISVKNLGQVRADHHEQFANCTYAVGKIRYWGNPRAIARFIEAVKRQEAQS